MTKRKKGKKEEVRIEEKQRRRDTKAKEAVNEKRTESPEDNEGI